MDESKFTHTLWMPYYLQGQFFRWYEAGIGYDHRWKRQQDAAHFRAHVFARQPERSKLLFTQWPETRCAGAEAQATGTTRRGRTDGLITEAHQGRAGERKPQSLPPRGTRAKAVYLRR